ncbi:hypothetical protein K9M79_05955 [Candidatus Woesearchaeota archaeon]|nr:hypothetical protein [Candidatus Woesearchaeota archaeon]
MLLSELSEDNVNEMIKLAEQNKLSVVQTKLAEIRDLIKTILENVDCLSDKMKKKIIFRTHIDLAQIKDDLITIDALAKISYSKKDHVSQLFILGKKIKNFREKYKEFSEKILELKRENP